MERPTPIYDNDMNLKATELRLGLPGSDEPQSSKTNKRPRSEIDTEAKKQQVVGWPPVRSFRKNVMKKPDSETGSGFFVKVGMDGAPYLRKVDLKLYNNYFDLLKALEKMFKCSIGGNGSEHAPTYEDKDGDWMLVGDVPWDMFITSCKRLRIMRGFDILKYMGYMVTTQVESYHDRI